ncbi:hypothetical protein [Arthrobacter livingstonensis]|uniref:hypothetical protein n=1 Tax=Arthrobacter livingstonensis TaxID=670078 RepID=UPI0011B80146|nr:hypothetical protein [Arthrobacter livingstonensis]
MMLGPCDRSDPVVALLAAPGLSLTTATDIPHGSDHDPERRDFAAALSALPAKRDFKFAIKMLADYAGTSLKAGMPLLQRSPKLKDAQWAATLAGITI